VSREQNSHIAQKLLASIGQGADPDEIATLFSGDVQFEIAGDVGALPWIGQKTGREAVSDFIRDTRRLTQPVRFDVQAILADDSRAVILGALASRVSATGKIIETAFAIILTIANLEITRFQMLEDSFAVSRAARP
jgi:ketosteroid isomerase-like protein